MRIKKFIIFLPLFFLLFLDGSTRARAIEGYKEGVLGFRWGMSFLAISQVVEFELLYRKGDLIMGCWHDKTDFNANIVICFLFYKLGLVESLMMFDDSNEEKINYFAIMRGRISGELGEPLKHTDGFADKKLVLLENVWMTGESTVELVLLHDTDFNYETDDYALRLNAYCTDMREYITNIFKDATGEYEMKKDKWWP